MWEVAGREMVGVGGGVFKFFGNLGGMMTPVIMGLMVWGRGC